MPAKHSILPHPCPICEKPNGTIQVGMLDELRFRIGHYNPQKYKQSKKEYQRKSGVRSKRKLDRGGRIWHDFRIDFLRTSSDLVNHKIISKKDISKKTSFSLSTNKKFCDIIKERGWHAITSNPTNKRKKNDKMQRVLADNKSSEIQSLLMLVVVEYKTLFEKNHDKFLKVYQKANQEDKQLIRESFDLIESLHNQLKKSPNTPLILKIIEVMENFLSFLATKFHLECKDLNTSQKHMRRVFNGRVKNNPLFVPKNKKDAISQNFVGVKCPNCKSWRVDNKELNLLYCWNCDEYFKQSK